MSDCTHEWLTKEEAEGWNKENAPAEWKIGDSVYSFEELRICKKCNKAFPQEPWLFLTYQSRDGTEYPMKLRLDEYGNMEVWFYRNKKWDCIINHINE
ncbi:MAG: hypothetical protein AABY22_25465 [Nanoarchaeota archaeon]